uniref:SKP1 component dimerisation domain-containing protein n=1 Tax=Leersia perrieri TaxID=77586 RepID=A0A0D9VDY0_9ORYZ
MANEASSTNTTPPSPSPPASSITAAAGRSKKATLRCSDGAEFVVSADMIAASSPTIKKTLDENSTSSSSAAVVSLPGVTGAALAHIIAADYLAVDELVDLMCAAVASRLEKSVERVREIFHIVNDFTDEEEEEIRKEIPWAFGDEFDYD